LQDMAKVLRSLIAEATAAERQIAAATPTDPAD